MVINYIFLVWCVLFGYPGLCQVLESLGVMTTTFSLLSLLYYVTTICQLRCRGSLGTRHPVLDFEVINIGYIPWSRHQLCPLTLILKRKRVGICISVNQYMLQNACEYLGSSFATRCPLTHGFHGQRWAQIQICHTAFQARTASKI